MLSSQTGELSLLFPGRSERYTRADTPQPNDLVGR